MEGDSEDSFSTALETAIDALDEDGDSLWPANEIVEDLTGEGNDAGNTPSDDEEPSGGPLFLDDGAPVIKPRPYQTEMLQESLKRNIIVAVGFVGRCL